MAKIIYAVSGGRVGYTETKNGAIALGTFDLKKANSDFFGGSEAVVGSDYFDDSIGGKRVEAVVKTGMGYRIQKRRIKEIAVFSDEDVSTLDDDENEDEDYDDEDEDEDEYEAWLSEGGVWTWINEDEDKDK